MNLMNEKSSEDWEQAHMVRKMYRDVFISNEYEYREYSYTDTHTLRTQFSQRCY